MKKVIFIFCIALPFFSCGNDDDSSSDDELSLPPITQNGANTMGCYIDDILFRPRSGNSNFPAALVWGDPSGNFQYQEYELNDNESEKTSSLLIHIHGIHNNGIGNYIINRSNGLSSIDGLDHTYMHCRIWRDDVGDYRSFVSYDNSGQIDITSYNLSNRLISGTFSGSVRNMEQPYDTIQITQGRFDFKWDTLDETDFP